MLKDLRFALFLISKERWYAAVAVVTLALGIGLNATVFTLVNAVLIRGLPFKDSGQLYVIGSQRQNGNRSSVSYADLRDWQAQTRTFGALAAFSGNGGNLSDDRNAPQQVRTAALTSNSFALLGTQPILGRDFVPEDERRGAARAVILGYTLWKTRYAGDPAIIGRSLRLNGQTATIIGVMPAGVEFPNAMDLWTPVVPDADTDSRGSRFLQVFGRLRESASRTQAQSEMNGIAARLAKAYPDTNKDFPAVRLETFNERFNGGKIRVVFLAMMGAVGFVLLIACANVANLQLSRSVHRSREIAVRIALGATRWRIVRQLLIESIVLGFMGGAIGLLLASGGVKLFDMAVQDVGKPYWIVFKMDGLVFAFIAAICIVTGILFGLAPALQVSRTNVNEILKEGGRGNAGSQRSRWMTGTMVVLELALTLVLLVGAGLMVRSFLKLYTLDLGIRTDHLMTMRMELPDEKYKNADGRRAFYDRLAPRLAALPGAESVSLTTSVPPFGTGTRGLEIEGRPARKPEERAPEVGVVTISPRFFDTVGVRLRRGRAFTETDGTPGAETVIVNDKLAAQFFPGEDPIGRRLRFAPGTARPGLPPPPAPVWRTIVGVSPAIRHSSPQDGDPPGVVYVPYRQEPSAGVVLLVRSQLEPGAVMRAVQREVQAADPDQPGFTVQTIDQLMAQQTWPYTVFGSLFAIFAVIALVMSAVGLYAVMAYSVTQRTAEIGVRMALGAEARQVSWLILKRGLLQLGLGLTFGLTGAY
ncbi:MAG TPA: ABC transporter permease, partial [Vicinamibacterales bacterium]|nr:ABC transporter permease [Vicinamibacterales bacterium]